jgi:hypothetical protein
LGDSYWRCADRYNNPKKQEKTDSSSAKVRRNKHPAMKPRSRQKGESNFAFSERWRSELAGDGYNN